MNWLKNLRMLFIDTPKWVKIATAAVFVIIVYFGIISNCIGYMSGNANGRSGVQYPTVYHLSSALPNTARTNIIYIVGIVLSLLLGLICLLLGIARSINKLDGKTSYLLAAFLVLFSINTFAAIDFVKVPVQPVTLFIIHWISYFTYAYPFLLFLYHILHQSYHRLAWPLLLLPMTYAVAAWVAYLVVGLPFELHDQLYTAFAEGCLVMLFVICFFGTVQKSALRYIKTISVMGIAWAGSIVIRMLLGYQLRIHEEVIIYIVIAAAVTVGYLVLSGTKELFTYKADAQILETKNELLLESYKSIESYMNQIASMKHEMKNKLLTMRILVDNNEYDRLAKCLAEVQDSYSSVVEPVLCGHHLIQSILSHANQLAHQNNIKINFDVDELHSLSITDADTVSLLMNLLNNAFESCEKIQPPMQRWISVSLKCRAPYLSVSVVNAMSHEVKHKDGVFFSTKKDSALHGHGISIVQSIVKKYDGISSFENTDDSFVAKTALRVIIG